MQKTKTALKPILIGLIGLVGLLSVASSAALFAAEKEAKDASDYEAAFERLQTLVGTWEYRDRDGETQEVVYSLTANGSALIERFSNMSSVYHMDGADLRVTHYCGAKNQPRMKAVSYDADRGVVAFDFVDVTNVTDPDAYFTRQVRITFFDDDHAEVHFYGLGNGEAFPVTIDLRRTSKVRDLR